MFKRIDTALPYDRDVRKIYLTRSKVLITNVSAAPNAKIIVLFDREIYKALPEQESTQERGLSRHDD